MDVIKALCTADGVVGRTSWIGWISTYAGVSGAMRGAG